ncbi:hypothetical protein FM076_18555 [Streptomyces albus subsp. chlorinus]|nr:hypothetical protein [Streptomyces albus subsp. chlorinus]
MDEAPKALEDFLAPFMERLTEKTLGNAVELMNEDERTEFDRLLGLASEPVRSFTPTPSNRGRMTSVAVPHSQDGVGL